MVLFDGEYIEDCVKTKTSINQRLFTEKKHYTREYSKWSDFGQNATAQF